MKKILIALILFSISDPAFAWPAENQWHVVVNETGNFTDLVDDINCQDYIQIVGNDTYPAAYIANDGTYIHFRLRIFENPIFKKTTYFVGYSWGVEFDTDGDPSNYEYLSIFHGGNGQQTIEFWEHEHGGIIGKPGDAATNCLWNLDIPNNNWTYMRAVDAPDIFGSGENNTFVDWKMPYDVFLNHTNLSNESSMRLIFGTSTQNTPNLKADIGNTALDGDTVNVSDAVSDPVLTMGTSTTNGSVRFVADMNGSGNVTNIIVNDTVYIMVDDTDRNFDPTSNQNVSVTLLTSNGDNETIILIETGDDTGVFTGSISTADTSVSVGDNILQVLELCTFNVTYIDTTAEGLYANITDNAIVTEITPPASVTSLANVTYNKTFINWTWTDPTDFDFDHVEVWIDSTFIINVSNGTQFYNATGLIPNTQYNISTRTVDIHSNINQTWVNHSAWTDRGIILPLINFTAPTPLDNSYLIQNYIPVNVTASCVNLKNITTYIYYGNGTLIDNVTNISSPAFNNFTGLSDGTYIINATAYDTGENSASTGNRTIILDTTPPSISFVSPTPANNSNLSQSRIDFNYTAIDDNLENITIYLYYSNGTLMSNTTYSTLQNWGFFNALPDGTYLLNATIYDEVGYFNKSETISITLDTNPPNINFANNTPANNSNLDQDYIPVNITVIDINLKNITTFLYYANGTLVTNITNSSSPAANNFTSLSPGVYLINATAYDWAGNYNTSKIRTITLLGQGSDLNLTSGNIIFVYDGVNASKVTETGEIKENVNLTINATIYNKGVSDSGNFYVLFYENSSEFNNVSMNSLAAGASANATAYLTTISGTHNITIKADPDGNTQDTDTNNNNASGTINVSAWQKYNGNVSVRTVLNDSASDVMLKWNWDNNTDIGNIYAVNKSVDINWSKLHPLGYDSDNSQNVSGTDFLDADINLGMIAGYGNATGFIGNNISELFTNTSGNNYGNISIDMTSFYVNGQVIYNVPVVNSTDMTDHTNLSNANFITGILWDGTKDTNGYYDTGDNENLVFIAIIKNAAVGADGKISNYEISIPCNLNPETGGELDFYLELR
ncbi:MAG: hypothetical protein K8R53_03055 [Bacteroidales bacterium]|nr:hypothetical protein [Bacteroidales bacterium]